MESKSKDLTLNNGLKMPLVGLGTYTLKNKEPIFNAIAKAGYRHLDTASLYANEDVIGEALEQVFNETAVKREELFIVTKIWPS